MLQLNKILRKGCKLNAIIAMNKKMDTISIDQYPMILEFSNVFREELPRLSPKIELRVHSWTQTENRTHRKGSFLHDDSRVVRVAYATLGTLRLGIYLFKYIIMGNTFDICKEEGWIVETLYWFSTIKWKGIWCSLKQI